MRGPELISETGPSLVVDTFYQSYSKFLLNVFVEVKPAFTDGMNLLKFLKYLLCQQKTFICFQPQAGGLLCLCGKLCEVWQRHALELYVGGSAQLSPAHSIQTVTLNPVIASLLSCENLNNLL